MNSVKLAYRQYLQTSEGADAYRDFKRILYGENDSLAVHISRLLAEKLSPSHRERMTACDIGGGDGDRISRIIRALHGQFGTCVDLDFVEQSMVYFNEFVPQRAVPCSTVHKIPGLFEDANLAPKAYDIVFLIHSIFAFENESTISKTLSLVKQGGLIVVVTNAFDSFLGGLKKIVDRVHADNRYELDALTADLKSREIKFAFNEFVTDFSIDEGSSDMDKLLQWISLGHYTGKTDPLHEEITAYIDSHSTIVDGRKSIHEREVLLLVPDQANLALRRPLASTSMGGMGKLSSAV